MTTERFYYLLDKYLKDRLSFEEKNEFFGEVASGKFDDVLGSHFDHMIYEEETFEETNAFQAIMESKIIPMIPLKDAEKEAGFFVRKKRSWHFAAAAVLVFVVALSFYFYKSPGSSNNFLAEFKGNSSRQVKNNTSSPLPVLLPDGSSITLQPASSIYYTEEQFLNKREVCMDGEAMFKITKDSLHPFLVYYNEVVTKVLGTSFTIRTNNRSGNIEVEVLTGRVQVYGNDKVDKAFVKKKTLVVTPNQKAVYQGDKQVFTSTLVDFPKPVKREDAGYDNRFRDETKAATSFEFDNTKLSVVLKSFELTYGIEMKAENEHVYDCEFSGNLDNEDLFDKLKIVCLATNLTYQINGTSILIKGEGRH